MSEISELPWIKEFLLSLSHPLYAYLILPSRQLGHRMVSLFSQERLKECNSPRIADAIIQYAGTRLAIIIQSSAAILVPFFFRAKNRTMTARVSMTPSAMIQRTAVSPRGLGDITRYVTATPDADVVSFSGISWICNCVNILRMNTTAPGWELQHEG